MRRRLPPDLARRLMLAYGAVVFLLIIVVFLAGNWYFQRMANQEINRMASTTGRVISHALERVTFSGKYHTRLLVEELAARDPDIAYISVLDEEGRVFAHSDPDLNDTLDDSPPAATARRLFQVPRTTFQDLEVDGRPVREVDVPLVGGYEEEIRGVVRVGISLDTFNATRSSGLLRLGVFSGLMAVASLLMLAWISAFFAGPMRSMAHTLQGILDHAPQAIFIQGRDGRLEMVNRNCLELLEEHEPPGSVADLFAPADRPGMQALDDKVFATEQPVQQEMPLQFKGAVREFQVVKFPLGADGGEGVSRLCTFLLDISETRQLQEQLRQSQKMEAMGHLAGGVAHDFNNLLMGIMGHADLIKMGVAGNADLEEDVDSLIAASHRAAELTRKLLAFSRRQVINPVPLDLNDTVERMQSLLERVISENIQLEFVPEVRGELTVLADPVHLDQILLNLVTNARDAMPGGGRVTIATAQTTVIRNRSRGGLSLSAGEYGVLEVSDTGCGMDAETLQKIFEPFFTTKEKGKGTGLGLSTVFGIVKQLHGSIEVNSRPGQGTSVRVFLPRVTEYQPVATTTVAEDVEVPLEREGLILVIEDDELVGNFIRRILVREGFEVLYARDGAEGLDLFLANRDRIRLTLTDVVMPELNGLEVRDRIRESDPAARVILMSGYTADVLGDRGAMAPGEHFMSKPVTRKKILATIAGALKEN